jgi:hypothetical protein
MGEGVGPASNQSLLDWPVLGDKSPFGQRSVLWTLFLQVDKIDRLKKRSPLSVVSKVRDKFSDF